MKSEYVEELYRSRNSFASMRQTYANVRENLLQHLHLITGEEEHREIENRITELEGLIQSCTAIMSEKSQLISKYEER